VEDIDIDIFDMTLENVGIFDVVLFAGVLYHLRNPFLAIERISALTNELMIVETHLDAMDVEKPAMIFYPGAELNQDPTNWWGPNPACVIGMLQDVGFRRVIYTPHPTIPAKRGIFHAYRDEAPPLGDEHATRDERKQSRPPFRSTKLRTRWWQKFLSKTGG
jgi:tRNA (mo5U34)-methyltransferase